MREIHDEREPHRRGRPARRLGAIDAFAVLTSLLSGVTAAGCRQIAVGEPASQGNQGNQGGAPSGSSGAAGSSGGAGLVGGIDQANPAPGGGQQGPSGGATPSVSSDGGRDGAAGTLPDGAPGGGARADGGTRNPDMRAAGDGAADAAGTGGAMSAAVTDIKVLAAPLNAIQVLSVGSDGVSTLQYAAGGAAVVLHVTWSGASKTNHQSSGAYHIYTAANGSRHAALLYAGTSYGVYLNGAGTEISGTPASYKEFLAANDTGLAWVDYGVVGTTAGTRPGVIGQPPVIGGGGTPPSGKIVFQGFGGGRRDVTDSSRYRARIAMSRTHVAFVEYASTAAGSTGQIVAQLLDGGAPSWRYNTRTCYSSARARRCPAATGLLS